MKKLLMLVVLCGYIFLYQPQTASGLPLTERYLRIYSSIPGETTEHEFGFTYAGSTNVGSIRFLYCNSPLPSDPCVAPSGLDMSSVSLSSQSGETGFTINSQTANEVILQRVSTPSSPVPSVYTFTNAVNPSNSFGAFFARISTYSSTDGTGSAIDEGSVVNRTAQTIDITSEVPPILRFCVGTVIGATCPTASGNLVQFGTLSAGSTSVGTSEFMATTNADFGFVVQVLGTTLTSGNNTIPAQTVPTASSVGTSQFGINLRDNSVPDVGAEPTLSSPAVPSPGYNQIDRFKFVHGDTVAQSPDVTAYNKFTVSYIANIDNNQPKGVYTATFTYVCTATF